MQTASFRYCLLAAVLLLGAGIYAGLGEPHGFGTPRWPESDAVFAAQNWTAGAQQVDVGSTTAGITRVYRDNAGTVATLFILTNQAPKLYGAGPEVPFLGNGYAVEPATPDIIPINASGVHALVASQGIDRWLVVYAYGERRGLLGNGPPAWFFAVFDGVIGRPNDYYKLYLATSGTHLDAEAGRRIGDLATQLFPRIAAYYAG